MIKYEATVTSIGPMASEFLSERILVLFDETAPQELKEFAVLHNGKQLHRAIEKGDEVRIDEKPFRVLAVGPIANDNLANLGHLVLKFNNQYEVEMPGDVCMESAPLPVIRVGTRIRIARTNSASR